MGLASIRTHRIFLGIRIPGEPPPHLPDIVHSTVLRWTKEPKNRAEAMEIFQKISERLGLISWEPKVPPPKATLPPEIGP